MNFEMSFDSKSMEKELKKLMKESPKALKKAMEIAGIQFLTWANNGSSKESRKPPIRRGFLRGSSSAFLGSELIGMYDGEDNREANKSYSDKDFVLTWGWNTEYATRMHETDYMPGPFSKQDGDAGNKWLERHLKSDRELLMAVIAKEFKKGLGT